SMVQIGKVMSNLMIDVRATNVKLRDRAIRIFCQLAECSREEAQTALEANDWDIRRGILSLKKVN
ncbi:MAG: N-acetylmuramic acid 6-phosphate etherase, partial [Verrucomicrobia bacterium]|nr:N-acetylmuramic acid 6-phosphate etherase [Verrucomicrobiota bacterium]